MEQSSDDKKKKQVEEILLMPIICNKFIKGTVRRGNWIYTGQKYCNSSDEDMSDFAVGFYEILYRNIINFDNNPSSILDSTGYFNDPNFAGDTMNSFRTVSNKYDKNSSKWSECLWDYFEEYHCLANFWILPMNIGRTSSHTPEEFRKYSKSKSGINDYMDRFLEYYKNNILEYSESFNVYFSRFDSFEDFATKHFLFESYIIGKDGIDTYSNLQNRDEVVKSMKSKIKIRANCISKSELNLGDSQKVLWKALWEYFDNLNIIQ